MTTRRSFIKNTSAATVAVGLGASMATTMGACSSDKLIRCGVIGARGMGFMDLQAFLRQPNTECVAICDVDKRVLDRRVSDTEKIQGKKPKAYSDYRQMIDDPDVDVVIIGTPDHWHCLPFVEACQAGKDIYCEKPLGNSIEEINIMERAANKYKTVVQVGQWQRSGIHWANAIDFVHSGKLGRIRTVRTWSHQSSVESLPIKLDEKAPEGVDYDFWLGPAPERPFSSNRFHGNFRWFWDYAGGLMTDWGVHIIDYGLLGMQVDAPKSVVAIGGKYAWPDSDSETPDTLQVIYDFGDFSLTWEQGAGIDVGDFGRSHGVAFIGSLGTLVVDRQGWEVIPQKKPKVGPLMEAVELQPRIKKGLDLHMANFLDGVRSRNRNLNCSVDIAANTARVAHLGSIAYRTGRKLYWDNEKRQFINDDEANGYLFPSYRSPWKLPGI